MLLNIKPPYTSDYVAICHLCIKNLRPKKAEVTYFLAGILRLPHERRLLFCRSCRRCRSILQVKFLLNERSHVDSVLTCVND